MSKEYKTHEGDCISSIAFDNGFLWKTIWNHPNNSELKNLREDPNILKEGDVVFIPDLTERIESCSSDSKHTFTRANMFAIVRLRLLKTEPEEDSYDEDNSSEEWEYETEEDNVLEEEPMASTPVHLYIDNNLLFEGETDAEGFLEVKIPPNAKSGRLVINPGTDMEYELALALGHVDPIDENEGICERLNSLGYDCDEDDDDQLGIAIMAFQENAGIEETGILDEKTKKALKKAFGA